MTIQRITNHYSAPISACLRAFVLAAETGNLMNSRRSSKLANIFNGGNAHVIGITQGYSAQLRGSA